MGLDTTHGCWHGPYSSFHAFRQAVARACDVDLDRMEGFCDTGTCVTWDSLAPDPIFALLNHSDCDGEIAVADLILLANRLDGIVAKLAEGGSELAAWTAKSASRFASGCRTAAASDEPVEFH